MFKKIKEKAGNEILQTLVIVAVLGALAITVCMALAGQLKQSSNTTINVIKEGTEQTK